MWLFLLALAVAGFEAAHAQARSPSFGPPTGPDVEVRRTETSTPAIAGDGTGNWVLCYPGNEPDSWLLRRDLYCSTSADGGSTWSMPVYLGVGLGISTGSLDEHAPSLATDAAGTWLMVFAKNSSPERIVVLRSIDNGATWSEQASPSSGQAAYRANPDIAHSNGVWIVAWSSNDDLAGGTHSDLEILYSRSLDAGATWSPAALVNAGAHGDSDSGNNPALAMDGSDVVAVWRAIPDSGDDDDVVYSRSSDAGQTWSPPMQLAADPDSTVESDPQVIVNASGEWLAGLIRKDFSPAAIFPTDVLVTTSSDAGATWSPAVSVAQAMALDPFDSLFGGSLSLGATPDGWIAAWVSTNSLGNEIGNDKDILASASPDGLSWATASTVNATAGGDQRKGPDVIEPVCALGADPAGNVVAAWMFGTVEEQPFFGPEYEYAPHAARLVQTCPPEPAADCLQAGNSRLKIRNRAGGRDDLRWSWKQGEATGAAELGNPTSSSDLVVCMYDTATPSAPLVATTAIAAGGQCGIRTCWKSSRADAYTYADKPLARGAVRKAKLRGGPEGKAIVSVSARGAHLGPPDLPTNGPILVQMHNVETGACWEADHSQVKNNGSGRFDASAP